MPYRILSLDGGGPWALIQVQALIALYNPHTTGHAVLRDFDLVAANSGGSFVLGLLIEDLPLSVLQSYFIDETKRKSIFPPSSSFKYWAIQNVLGIGPKYSAEDKLPAIKRLLPNKGYLPLTQVAQGIKSSAGADVHILITSFNYDLNRATFFRSASATGPAWGSGAASTVTLAEAIHASTNAPVMYFDAPAEFPGQPDRYRYWDGAVTGCNNPVLAAVTEAIMLGQKPTDIVALSLGTGSVVLPLVDPGAEPSIYEAARIDSGLKIDIVKLATAILDDPPDAATFIAHIVTGSGIGAPAPAVSRIVRMNPLICPLRDPPITGNWTAPKGMTGDQFQYLCRIDMDAIAPEQMDAILQLAQLWLAGEARNQPIRIDGKTLEKEIGYDRFQPAMDAWNKIRV